MQGGKSPTAAEQRWQNWLREQGCYLGMGPACIHHCVGSTARHNKIHIGQAWCIPLSYEAHQGPRGIHGNRVVFAGHGLGETRKEIEKTIFRRLVAAYRHQHGELPLPADVIAAVEDWHR